MASFGVLFTRLQQKGQTWSQLKHRACLLWKKQCSPQFASAQYQGLETGKTYKWNELALETWASIWWGLNTSVGQLGCSECFSVPAVELGSGDLGHASLQVWAGLHAGKAAGSFCRAGAPQGRADS